MTIFDHAMAFVLLVALPAYAAWAVPRMRRQIEAGDPNARLKEYAETIVLQWALVGAVAAVWLLTGRQALLLGVAWPEGIARTVSLIVALAGVIFFTRQTQALRTSVEGQAQVRAQLAAQPAVRVLIPRTAAEARLFHALAITAGVCEEVLYRGFLWWYVATIVGPGVLAFGVTALAFGVAHAYQGSRGALLAGIIGTVALALYVGTGSLFAPIVLHATIDFANGIIARIAETAIVPSAPDGDHHHLDEAGSRDEAGADGRAGGRL